VDTGSTDRTKEIAAQFGALQSPRSFGIPLTTPRSPSRSCRSRSPRCPTRCCPRRRWR
jgi:hypothetical protein